jgi:hypothetical protein
MLVINLGRNQLGKLNSNNNNNDNNNNNKNSLDAFSVG